MWHKKYIIEFEKREQYDCDGNCTKKAVAELFTDDTTLAEIVEWVKKEVGPYPKILGIKDYYEGGEK